jgi:hypothetical protein
MVKNHSKTRHLIVPVFEWAMYQKKDLEIT